jgi:hypothetical protein
MAEAPRVFISYSHDSDAHRARVLALSERLRRDGIPTVLDRYVNGAPPEGWPRWMLDRLDEVERVLLVCTPTYYRRFRGHEEPGKGKGVDWEGAIMTQAIYDARSHTTRFIPVLFDRAHQSSIPDPVRGQGFYCLDAESGYQALYDALLDQAGVEPGPVGELKPKPRPRGEPLVFPEPGARSVRSPSDSTDLSLVAPVRRDSPAAQPSAPVDDDRRGDWVAERDEDLVKVFDHQTQLSLIARVRDSATDPAIFLFHARSDDWPSYLADHLLLDPWPDGRGPLRNPVHFALRRYDRHGFWEALLQMVPGAHETTDEAAQRTRVREWLRGDDLWVFSVMVELRCCGGQLPEILRGAHTALAALGDLGSGTRVLVLFACISEARRAPFWRGLWSRLHSPSFTRLGKLCELESADIERWFTDFPKCRKQDYNHDQIKADLLKLFTADKPRRRYSDVRNFLVGDLPGTGALSKARLRDDPLGRYD